MKLYFGKTTAIFVALFLAFSFLYVPPLRAKTLNLPQITAKEAIDIAEDYIKNNHIDVSRSYLLKVEYFNLYEELQKPYWSVEYRIPHVKGGQTYVLVYNDKRVVVQHGE